MQHRKRSDGITGAGELAQLRALVFAKDLSSIPSTDMQAHHLLRHQEMHVVLQTDTKAKHSYI